MDRNAAAFVLNEAINYVRETEPRMEAQTIEMFSIIAREPDISQGELAKRLRLTVSSAGRNVDHLGDGGPRHKGLGLVVRYEDPVDRRTKRVKLTKAGEKWWKELSGVLDNAVMRAKGKKTEPA